MYKSKLKGASRKESVKNINHCCRRSFRFETPPDTMRERQGETLQVMVLVGVSPQVLQLQGARRGIFNESPKHLQMQRDRVLRSMHALKTFSKLPQRILKASSMLCGHVLRCICALKTILNESSKHPQISFDHVCQLIICRLRI